jgi:RNA polymerase sigma-70 factor (ECF subfamily)
MESIESLPPRCREVFMKSRFEQKKYAEIATELDISVKTVEVQMGKALKVLRRALFGALALMSIFWLLYKT